MTYTIKKAFAILSLAIFGSALLYNCEPDPDSLGEQLFLDGAANGKEVSFPVIAYNINNNDSIRSDAAKLGLATLGGLKDAQFGKQKASYYTQLRLPSYNPDFGTNAAIDSVVLVIKPTYASDSITTTTNDSYTYPDGNVPAKKVVNTYPAIKYGRTKAPKLTIKVNEVTEFLNGVSDIAYSNKVYSSGDELGRKDFTGTVNSVTITKTSDASSLFTSAVGFRIPLSASFFKTKILDKKGQPELSDVSNFIRYFKGLKLSVEEDDAYLTQFSPNDMELVMYYKNDKNDNGTITRPQTTYTFALGSANAHIGNYVYDRFGTPSKAAIDGSNQNTGDERLYAQGMGGPSIGVKLPLVETINELKKLYKNNKAAIISAKIRVYTDDVNWTNQYAKPKNFTIVQRDKDANGVTTAFTTDLLNLTGANNFAIYRAYDLDKNPTYYDFTVTKSVKDIVEASDGTLTDEAIANKYFKIDMGNFLTNTAGSLAGYQYTSRPYAVDRAVFIGSNSTNAHRIQLIIIYGTK
ncbi:DUF4270 family protein [Chryseobacterium polytrichastri]|uniref:DUF4270 domain-containing protein n=1 Tax=Chryseobacterium polytrichastri TaxID=1302687 RepID=A0A1M6WBY4_9FLAO|nr:DUF4270 family protein [Chryseobacterium polytrichastri]SHK91272.1 protein of unknown function [Chryseobacterium polytrichastri]